ncbi:MAG TPA: glycosyltransferase family 4 protein [Pirellulales bacterium]|nr:glycosyltransferase family 4 protein [Pirellulales bacterium]
MTEPAPFEPPPEDDDFAPPLVSGARPLGGLDGFFGDGYDWESSGCYAESLYGGERQMIWGDDTRGEPPWGPEPLRVIHVGQSMVRAGVEQWLKSLTRFLDPRRVRLVRAIVTAPDMIDPTVVPEMLVPVEIGQAAAVVRAARECDLLLCWGPAELGAWLAPCRPKLCVFVAHGEGIWTRRILQGCAPVLDHVVAVSRRVRERVAHDVPATVIHNGVDSAHIARSRSRQAARHALGFDGRDFVLGYVGRFSPEKRVHAVLEAVALLPPHFKILLIGWGRQCDELRQLAECWLSGRAVFVTGRDYLGDYYHAMDALCVVSEGEGFSLSALEGLMCGLPLIATPVGFVPEFIEDRINGLVVSGTIDSICRAAELLHDHPAWARGMAAEGRALAEKHGHARTMARRYEHLFERLWSAKFGLRGNGS